MKKYSKEERRLLIQLLINRRRDCKNKRMYLALTRHIEKLAKGL